MSGKKNLHEGNILYFSLKVCKKTGTKKMWKKNVEKKCGKQNFARSQVSLLVSSIHQRRKHTGEPI